MTLLINRVIASELQVQEKQVVAAVQLLDEGSTVPFIARYRKEVTGGLDDTQLRHLEVRLLYLRELNQRRATIINSIEQQGKLTAELADAINCVMSKTELEDLYLPYKPKRRTRGQIAIEAGLTPLADQLWQQPDQVPEVLAEQFIDADKGINDSKAALDGARYILMEHFAEDATLLALLRQYLWRHGVLIAKVLADQAEAGAKFSDYFDYQEAIAKIPSHRALALFRGRNEGILQLSLQAEPAQQTASTSMGEQLICQHLGIVWQGQAADGWRQSVISWTWKIKLLLHLESELLATLREQAENEAINVFARNLRDLLMAAPAGMRVTIGLDPGLRTGVKMAVVDQTGKLLDTQTIYPHTGQAAQAAKQLSALCQQYQVELVAIGNGTASRETERFYAQLQQQFPQVSGQKVIVSEAGASVYSASALAAQEFPQLDVSLRGAVSIARRLQDPLAELVKIDPKSIGVGQYQHDVNQGLLAKKLDTVVEDCVNAVGVDLNTASVALLSRVAGLTESIAQNVVAWRDQHGRFTNRQQLKQVARLGDKTFEQCAGFLRIVGGDNPLDASTVHPESYPVVEKILQASQKSLPQLMGQPQWLSNLNAVDFVDEQIGLPTVRDILNELAKPGRDPRPEFKTASFTEGVNQITDLRVDMVLEGTVTNVTNFGAFVDIGVHQDGLVHISLLADKFVSDPHQVVKAGDIVTVKVVEVDTERKRIALSMRLSAASSNDNKASSTTNNRQKHSKQTNTTSSPPSAMAAAFSAALTKK